MSKVSMVSVSLIGAIQDEARILNRLQDVGLLHVVPFSTKGFQAANSGALQVVQSDIEVLDEAIAILSNTPASHFKPDRKRTLQEVAAYALTISAELIESRKELEVLGREIDQLRPWGQVNGADFEFLSKNGVDVVLSIMTLHEWENFEKSVWKYKVVSKDEEHVWVSFFCSSKNYPAVRQVHIPEGGLQSKILTYENLQAEITDRQGELSQLSSFLPQLKRHRHTLDEREARAQAQEKAMHDEVLFGVQGFVPAASEISLREAMSGYGVYLQIEPALDSIETPVLLKNNWLFSGFEALVSAFSGVDYREKDYTWSVGLLFIVFGSLCLLDAGYGLLLFATGAVLYWKGEAAFGKVFLWSGAGATLMGGLCGSLFGFSVGKDFLLESKPMLSLAQEPLEFFYFSLKVGLVVMGLSYLVAIWQRGMKTQATGSFLFVLTFTCLALVNSFDEELREPLTTASYGLAGMSILAWALFPEKVFGEARLPNIIWTLYSGITGLVQDILSHMRLFGIALSGAILMMVVNQLAGMMPLWQAILFGIFTHFLVFLLSLLSLYIHSNRLIFLEFGSKCIDGGHCYYKPLRRGITQ